MNKKMTLKEFKFVFEEVGGMSMDVWGWDGILNLICLARRYTADSALKLGCALSAKRDLEVSNAISDYLDKHNYM